jgi:hypothetical protein
MQDGIVSDSNSYEALAWQVVSSFQWYQDIVSQDKKTSQHPHNPPQRHW